MAAALPFDTFRFVKRLTAGGFTEAQAETLACEQANLLDANLANKGDLARVEAELEADIARVEAELKADIAKVAGEVEKVRAELKTDIARVEAELKTDLARVEAELKVDIARVQAELKTDIAKIAGGVEKAKVDLLKWMVGALIAHAALMAALIRLP